MEPRRHIKAWILSCVTTLIIFLDSSVDAEKKRLYIKTEASPKQVHHHHYYAIPDPMFGSSRNVPMNTRPSPEVFDRVRYNRGSPSSRFNHVDYYHDHSDYPSQPDHYHDDYDSYSKAARLLRMTPPPMSPPSYVHHQPPLDVPDDTMPPKSSRSRRVPTYHVSPDVYSPQFQRYPYPKITDKHHSVRHVYTSEVEEDDY